MTLVFGTLFIKESLNSITLITYLVFWIVTKKYRRFKIADLRPIGQYLIILIVYLIWIFYRNFESLEWHKATDLLVKQGSLVLFPIILHYSDVRKNEKKILDTIFFYIVFIFCCYLYLNVFLKYLEIGAWYVTDPEHPTWKYPLYSSGRLSPYVHPTFLSMFIVYGIYSYYPTFRSKGKFIGKVVDLFIFISLTITLVLLSSRGVLFSLFILFCLFQVRAAIRGKYLGLVYLLFVLLGFCFLFSTYGPFKRISKLRNIVKMDIYEIANTQNSTGKRVQTYLVAMEMIKDNFWLGIGTKNWQKLNKNYYSRNYKSDFEYGIDTLNTHNQYLNALVSWGFIGLILFILIFSYQIYFSSFLDNGTLLFLWGFISILLLTENIMNRHLGIIFLALVSGFTVQQFLDKSISSTN